MMGRKAIAIRNNASWEGWRVRRSWRPGGGCLGGASQGSGQGGEQSGDGGQSGRRLSGAFAHLNQRVVSGWCRARAKLACQKGQGTTEYAILVGVLVVIAIIAITVFRPKLEELWNAIADGINSL